MSIAYEPLILGPEHAGILMTPEEFDAIEDADENYVYELIDGVLIVAPPPSEGERGPNEYLAQILRNYQDDHPQGSALNYTLSEHAIRTRNSRRRADRVIWAGLGRTPNVRRDMPSIAIEFVSVGKRSRVRDYEAKRDEYLAAGVVEYWVIDRFRRQMTVFRRDGRRIAEVVIREADSYTTPLLPGFELPLAKVLAEADKLAAAQGSE
jgi:Uma2 family endonuclease